MEERGDLPPRSFLLGILMIGLALLTIKLWGMIFCWAKIAKSLSLKGYGKERKNRQVLYGAIAGIFTKTSMNDHIMGKFGIYYCLSTSLPAPSHLVNAWRSFSSGALSKCRYVGKGSRLRSRSKG